MMNLKNLFRSGDYVVPVPFGGHITLQYDDSGNLEKAFKGWDTIDEITSDISLFNSSINTFPQKITARTMSGTCWVYGVLYSATNIMSAFDSVNDAIIDMYVEHPELFSFFACNAKSTAYSFKGSSSLTTWFKSNRFSTLNGFLVGANYNDAVLNHFIETQFPFKCPQFASYLIINGDEVRYIETEVHANIVESVKYETNKNGQILAKLTCKNGKVITVDYSVVVDYNIHKNSCILQDEDGVIRYSYFTDNKNHAKPSDNLVCDVCGKPIKVKSSETTICSNEHCLSRMYPDITHTCNMLDIPVLSYEDYKKYVNKKSIKYISDILNLDEYQDIEIHTTLSKLLNAIIPVRDVRQRSILNVFCNNCSNNIQTVLYYVDNPSKISSELGIGDYSGCKEFVKWLNDEENRQCIDNFLHSKKITFDVSDKKFDGDPILRGKVIYITGFFNHGSVSDIIEILQSYAAKVVTEYDSSVNMVLVGDISENVNGVSLKKAKKDHVPVFQESGFFKMYDIDEDLKKNL